MSVSGELHAPTAFFLRKDLPILTGYEAGWTPEPVGMLQRRETLALTSLTSGGRSVGIVRLRTTATEFLLCRFVLARRAHCAFSTVPVSVYTTTFTNATLFHSVLKECYLLQKCTSTDDQLSIMGPIQYNSRFVSSFI
jgi:hypothetical protein